MFSFDFSGSLAHIPGQEDDMEEFDGILRDGTARFALRSRPCSPN